MHTFDVAGEFAVFYDAFGLTSFDLVTGKFKNDKALSGIWFSSNGGTALAHNERANARNCRAVGAHPREDGRRLFPQVRAGRGPR